MSTSWDDLIEKSADEEREEAREERADKTVTGEELDVALAARIERLDHVRSHVKNLKDEEASLEADIFRSLSARNPGAREHIFTFAGRSVQASVSERWKWDKAGLEQKYAGDEEPPHYVDRSFTVRKPVFEKLSANEQDELRPFLTIDEGKPKIEVKLSDDLPPLSELPF